MAKRTTVTIHDDLDGSEGASTVKFGLDGKSYEIDLNGKHEAELRKALEKYVAAATQVTASESTTSTGRRKYGTGPARRDTKHIREWLRSQGIEISDRGRIPTDLMGKYENRNAAGSKSAPAPAFSNASSEEKPAGAKTAGSKPAPSRKKAVSAA